MATTVLSCNPGAYTLTSMSAPLVVSLSALPGAYTLTGIAVTLAAILESVTTIFRLLTVKTMNTSTER